jgi:hypothetical protein
MKSLKLAVIVSAVMLSVAGLAQAESSTLGHEESVNRLNHNFNSKRPYQAPVENNKTNKVDEQFEGATLVPEDENSHEVKNERNLKQLRLHSLGRRPYME